MLDLIRDSAIAFAAMFALDFVWVFYTAAVVAKRPQAAGVWAAGITALNGVAAVIYVGNPLTIIPAALGAFCGTLLAMRKVVHAAPQAKEGQAPTA